jgi:hypothetical protein
MALLDSAAWIRRRLALRTAYMPLSRTMCGQLSKYFSSRVLDVLKFPFNSARARGSKVPAAGQCYLSPLGKGCGINYFSRFVMKSA